MTGHDSRDEALGAALRALEVPEHRPGFHEDLRAALQREAARRGAGPSRVRRPRGRRWHPGRRGWAWGLASAAAIAAVAVAAVMVGVPGQGPGVASAAAVRARVARAWASAEAATGVMVIRWYPQLEAQPARGEERWRFVLTARGDFRTTSLSRAGDVAYDARANVERSLSPSASIPDSEVAFAAEITGLAPGPPDPGPSTAPLDRALGSVVRALAAGTGGEVREVVHQGREAWLLDATVSARGATLPDRLQVTVDRETGFPVRVVAFREGRRLYEHRIEDLRVDPPVPEDAFRLEFPRGAEVSRTDHGFRRVPLDEVEAAVGYEPVVPAWVPDGYRLSEVMVSTEPSLVGVDNPEVGDVVSLSFRRGLDRLIVTTRPAGEDRAAWSDPFYAAEGPRSLPERVALSAGVLRGRPGELVIDPMSWTPPHLWAATEELVATVSGDLTRAELLQVAESLGPVGR